MLNVGEKVGNSPSGEISVSFYRAATTADYYIVYIRLHSLSTY